MGFESFARTTTHLLSNAVPLAFIVPRKRTRESIW